MTVTTFNPNDRKSALVVLSNGNMTATGTDAGGNNWARSTKASSGRRYFEVAVNTAANTVIGISRKLPVTYPGADANSFGMYSNGAFLINGGSTSVGVTYGSGNTVEVAIDFVAKLAWFRMGAASSWNNATGNSPATGVGGLDISAYSATGGGDNYIIVSGDNGCVATLNCGASAFVITSVPWGYKAWDGPDVDFPSSPTDGQVFVVNTQPPAIYVWNAARGAWLRPRGTANPQNKFVNPTMQVSQENANTAGTTNTYFAADQWQSNFVNSALPETPTFQRVQQVTPRGSPNQVTLSINVSGP
jgi:hypothetical protein